MKKWIVRYEVEGFVVKEMFKKIEDAEKFYDRVLESLEDFLITIDLYKI